MSDLIAAYQALQAAKAEYRAAAARLEQARARHDLAERAASARRAEIYAEEGER